MSSSDNESAIVEAGLKREIGRQSRMKKDFEKMYNTAERNMYTAWNALYSSGFNQDQLREMIWNYIDKLNIWVNAESKYFNIYTHIAEYENKQGKKHLAHFTEHDNYFGPVSKLGDKPVSYMGQFTIDRSTFEIVLEKFNTEEGFRKQNP